MAYIPAEAAEMTTPLVLQIPSAITTYNGVRTKPSFTDADGIVYANFKTYGGTETRVNGIFEVIETAQIVCWYRPDITSDCRIKKATDGAVYEIIGDPENIDERNQFLKFKVRRIKGGV